MLSIWTICVTLEFIIITNFDLQVLRTIFQNLYGQKLYLKWTIYIHQRHFKLALTIFTNHSHSLRLILLNPFHVYNTIQQKLKNNTDRTITVYNIRFTNKTQTALRYNIARPVKNLLLNAPCNRQQLTVHSHTLADPLYYFLILHYFFSNLQ